MLQILGMLEPEFFIIKIDSYFSTLPQQVTALANQIDTLQTHESFSQEVEIAVTADRKSHNKVKSKLERSALPRGTIFKN